MEIHDPPNRTCSVKSSALPMTGQIEFLATHPVVGAHYWGSGAGTSDFTSVLW
jgi:hypothetical protein